MVSIKELINERQAFAINVKGNKWGDEMLEYVMTDIQDEVFFVTVASALFNERKRNAIEESYHFAGVYHLGRIFNETNLPFYLVHLTKSEPVYIKTSVFHWNCSSLRLKPKTDGSLSIPDTYTEEWESYINMVESWINGGKEPEDCIAYEFNVVWELHKNSLLPEHYTKESVSIRKMIEAQDNVPLASVADILVPHEKHDSKEQVKVFKGKNMKYPLDLSEIEDGDPTDITLKKGDVLISRFGNTQSIYLFNSDEKNIYASPYIYVLRCKGILPQYLFLYLRSETAFKVFNADSGGEIIHAIPLSTLTDFPIVKPAWDDDEYIRAFEVLMNEDLYQNLNYYYYRKRRLEFYKFKLTSDELDKAKFEEEKRAEQKTLEEELASLIFQKPENCKNTSEILSVEILKDIKMRHEDVLRSFLSDDLKELNTCFRHGAYKATLILAGSILEAVLIDWLSEIHHENYFEKPYKWVDENGREKLANLSDYIDAIEYIKRPDWMEEAEKAHEIRNMRNLVHAKLCLKEDKITKEVCETVVSYLGDVLRTRGNIAD